MYILLTLISPKAEHFPENQFSSLNVTIKGNTNSSTFISGISLMISFKE